MTDLERRALLGDLQAQEECTNLGIVILLTALLLLLISEEMEMLEGMDNGTVPCDNA